MNHVFIELKQEKEGACIKKKTRRINRYRCDLK